MIPIYIVIGWCGGFGNDGYIKGIYTSLENAKQHANYTLKEARDKIFRVALDTEINYDYYDEDIIDENRKWDRKRKRNRV